MSKSSAKVQVCCWFPGYILQCSQAIVYTGRSKTDYGDFRNYPLREKKEMRENELMSEGDQMKYLILIFARRISDCYFIAIMLAFLIYLNCHKCLKSLWYTSQLSSLLI